MTFTSLEADVLRIYLPSWHKWRSLHKVHATNGKMEVTKLYSIPKQDLREMSTYDLIEMLKKPEWKRDTDQEKKLCELILKQLDDTSGDVSSLAVKWYAQGLLWFCLVPDPVLNK